MRCGVPTSSRVYLIWHKFISYNQYYTTPKEEPADSLVLWGGSYTVRRETPPQQATLTLGLYADGYHPGGRPNVNTKICILHFVGESFPRCGHVPRCTDMTTCMEVPKVVDGEWLPKRAKALRLCKFKQRMKYGGAEYTTTLHLQFGSLTADHHHLWSQ